MSAPHLYEEEIRKLKAQVKYYQDDFMLPIVEVNRYLKAWNESLRDQLYIAVKALTSLANQNGNEFAMQAEAQEALEKLKEIKDNL